MKAIVKRTMSNDADGRHADMDTLSVESHLLPFTITEYFFFHLN